MLDAKFIAARKKDLEKERVRLTKEIAERNKHEEIGHSEDDNAQEVQQFEENLFLRANLEQQLAAVSKALAKIENGTYGRCEMGPEEIELERLEAFPSAMVCIKHQSAFERRSIRSWWKPWSWRK